MKKISILGIEIDNKEIKFYKSKKNSTLPVISVPTPEDTYYDGEVTDIDQLCTYMTDVIKKNRIHSKKVGLVINSTQTIIRPFTIKNQKDDKLLRNSIELQISEVFNDILNTHVLGIKIESRSQENVSGLLTLVPYEIIHSQYRLLEKMNKKIMFMDVTPNCITKYYNTHLQSHYNSKSSIMVQITESVCTVNLIHDNQLIYTKGQWFHEDFYNNVENDIRVVIDMVRQSIDYAMYNQMMYPVENIFLCVGNHVYDELTEALKQSFSQEIIVESEQAMNYSIKGALIRCTKECIKEI